MSQQIEAKQKLVKLLSALTGESWEVDLNSPNGNIVVGDSSFICMPGYAKGSNDNITLTIFNKTFTSSKGSFKWDDMTKHIIQMRDRVEAEQLEKRKADKIYFANVDKVKHQVSKFSSFGISDELDRYGQNSATVVPNRYKEDSFDFTFRLTVRDGDSASLFSLLEMLAKGGLVKKASEEAAMVARMTQVSPIEVQDEWDKQPQNGENVQLMTELPESVILSVA